LIKGLSRSPIPVAAPLAGFLNETRAPLSAAYRFGLRVWLALALLLASSMVSSALGHVAALLSLWLPSASAAALFAGAGPLLVGRVVHSAGYNLFNFTRAFSVVNRQSALACFLLRSASQASTSSFSIC